MEIKVKACVSCHFRHDERSKLQSFCSLSDDLKTIPKKNDGYVSPPDWCPLRKESVFIELLNR